MTRSLCIAGILGASILGAWGREIVVDGSAGDASDTGPGTVAVPFRTIAAAARAARAGDTVRVKAGVYRESVLLTHSGTADAPIRFVADPVGQVVVTGADLLTGWTRVPGDAPIWQVPWPHLFAINHINGVPVEHHPEYNPRWGRAEQVVADGNQLVIVPTVADLGKSVADHREEVPKVPRGTVGQRGVPDVLAPETWYGTFTADTKGKILYVRLADGSDPNDHTMEASVRSQLFGVNQWQQREGVEHVQVRGFVFRYGSSFPQRGILALHGRNNLVEDCLIDAASGAGAAVCGTMRRCIIRRCGHVGGGAVGNGFVNEDLLVEDNSWKPIRRGWDAGGAKSARAHGGIVTRCIYRRNGGPGLWFDIDLNGITVTESVFMDNEMAGLFVEISRNFDIRNNLFVRNAAGSVRCGDWHDWGSAGIMIAESINCRIENNTCVGNKDGIAIREQGPRPLDTPDLGELPYYNHGHVIRKNVCADNLGYQLGLWYDNAFFGMHPSERDKYAGKAPPYEEWVKTVDRELYDPRKADLTIDGNLYSASAGQHLFLFGCPWRERSRTFDDLAGFREHSGFEANGAVAAMKAFANPEADDYRLGAAVGVGWADPPADIEALVRERYPEFR